MTVIVFTSSLFSTYQILKPFSRTRLCCVFWIIFYIYNSLTSEHDPSKHVKGESHKNFFCRLSEKEKNFVSTLDLLAGRAFPLLFSSFFHFFFFLYFSFSLLPPLPLPLFISLSPSPPVFSIVLLLYIFSCITCICVFLSTTAWRYTHYLNRIFMRV